MPVRLMVLHYVEYPAVPPWLVGKTLTAKADHKTLTVYFKDKAVAILMSLGEDAKVYIEHLAASGAPLKKSVTRLLALKHDFGSVALLEAIRRALAHKAFGADYIENILYQDMTPTRVHLPVRIEIREALNRIRLQEPTLADYDTFVAARRKDHV